MAEKKSKKNIKKKSKTTNSKKTIKKSTVKKTTAKKSNSNKLNLNKKVSDDKVFFLIDGTTISSLRELIDAFDRMSDDIYYYHVTNDRNDFSNWVKDVLRIEKLADELIGANGAMKAECIVLKHLLKF